LVPGHPLTRTENVNADRPRGTPPPGELNPIGVAKYSDFGPIEGYTVSPKQCKIRDKLVLKDVAYELSIGTKIGDLE